MDDLTQLVRSHAARVRRVLARAGVAPRDLPDAQQEVFIVAQRKLAEFEGRASIATWLHRIARNVASQHRRLARNRNERLDVQLVEPACAAPGPEASVEASETRAFLARALEALPTPQREALVLHDLAELSMHEVAQAQNVPLKTAFSRVYAARRALKLAHGRWSALPLGLVLAIGRRARALLLPARLAQLNAAAVALACALLGPAPAVEPSLPAPAPAARAARLPVRTHAELVAPAPEVAALAAVVIAEPRRAARRVARPRSAPAPEPPAPALRRELVVVHESGLDAGPRLTHPFTERIGLEVRLTKPRVTPPLPSVEPR
jgi:RNA polymerase sigma-70 factor (ECF subfamily)